jgi:mitochondrial fission protein ELM1
MLYLQDEWILFAARAGLLAMTLLCFALAFASWRRSGRRDMQSVMTETRALSELTQRLTAQLAAMEARMEDGRQLVAVSVGSAQRGYDLAMQMARNGAAVEQIAATSGVARNEAQLLASLHGPARN